MVKSMRGDKKTDRLYGGIRGRFGERSPLANGYRTRAYFLREQSVLHELLNPDAATVLDVGCGSGLMLRPLVDGPRFIFGIDFNADACRAALTNGFPIVRGDAFALPFKDASIDELTSCQFFNQQRAEALKVFSLEAARVLRPGGRAVLVWRNGAALIHRLAHACLCVIDRLRGLPEFPQFVHSIEDLRSYLTEAGLEIEHAEVTFPALGWHSKDIASLAAGIIGASCIVIARKPVRAA